MVKALTVHVFASGKYGNRMYIGKSFTFKQLIIFFFKLWFYFSMLLAKYLIFLHETDLILRYLVSIVDTDGHIQVVVLSTHLYVKTLRPRQNGRHFPDDIFKCIFLTENVWIAI